MRLADRLFAFWRFPAWSDSVQVLLWLVGWSLVAGPFVLFAPMASGLLALANAFAQLGPYSVLAVLILLLVLGWAVVGCWFVSEAYRLWREGDSYGRQWALIIGAYLVLALFPMVALRDLRIDDGRLALASVRAALGTALLVALATTKPPTPLPATPA